MKILLCLDCADLVSLAAPPTGEWRACYCGRSRGRYVDRAHAEFSGPAKVLGLGNEVLALLARAGGVPLGLQAVRWPHEHRATRVPG